MSKPLLKSSLPGFSVAVAAGIAVWFFSSLFAWMDPLVAGIIFGMLLGTVLGEKKLLTPGLNWAPKFLIPPGIILYGANLQFDFKIVSPIVWLQILVGLVIVVWLATTVGKWFKLPGPMSLLLAVGTAVCGASAIVIATETVDGKKRDTATSLLVITIWGLVGLMLLPYFADLIGMHVPDRALLFATTLHQTGLVKSAAIKSGIDCLNMAMAIKTARIVMIIPLLFIVGTVHYVPYLRESTESEHKFKVKIPWYLWGFIISGICFSFIPFLAKHVAEVNPINALIWTMAMVSIGLTVNAKKIVTQIFRPLMVGLILWLGLIMVFLYTYFNAY